MLIPIEHKGDHYLVSGHWDYDERVYTVDTCYKRDYHGWYVPIEIDSHLKWELECAAENECQLVRRENNAENSAA